MARFRYEAIEQSGQKISDGLKLEYFLKNVEQTISVPLDAFKVVIQSILYTKEKV